MTQLGLLVKSFQMNLNQHSEHTANTMKADDPDLEFLKSSLIAIIQTRPLGKMCSIFAKPSLGLSTFNRFQKQGPEG